MKRSRYLSEWIWFWPRCLLSVWMEGKWSDCGQFSTENQTESKWQFFFHVWNTMPDVKGRNTEMEVNQMFPVPDWRICKSALRYWNQTDWRMNYLSENSDRNCIQREHSPGSSNRNIPHWLFIKHGEKQFAQLKMLAAHWMTWFSSFRICWCWAAFKAV